MASTYTPISTTTLGSAATSYTFSSIPSTYTDLVLVASGGNNATLYMQMGNGSVDGGTNYSRTQILGDGTSATSGRASTQSKAYLSLTSGAGTIETLITNIMNYSNTTTYKTFITRYNDTSNYTGAIVGMWRSTAAVNIITIYGDGTNIPAGYTFTLYGIKAA